MLNAVHLINETDTFLDPVLKLLTRDASNGQGYKYEVELKGNIQCHVGQKRRGDIKHVFD